MKTCKTSDFRLTFAAEGIEWASAPRPKLPIMRWPDGTICEPIMYYFGYSAEKKRVKISSMAPEAYALREWLVFLINDGLNLFQVNDDVMERWRTQQGWIVVSKGGRRKLKRNDRAKNIRIGLKLHYVFEFYRLLPKAMPFFLDGTKTPTFVGKNNVITSKMSWNGRWKKEFPIWSRAEVFSPIPKPPQAPREQDVLRLYSWLRGKAFRLQQELKLAFPPDDTQILADRNWLLARTMTMAGLRCDEIGEVNVDRLAQALLDNGITKELCDLDKISYDKEIQRSIIGRILSLRKGTEYAFVSMKVKGKGDKERMAPFDPQLVCDLLEIGVWKIRQKHIRDQLSVDPTSVPTRSIFLSEKNFSEPLNAKSIGNIIGAAFKELGIRSSAHKLRAYFATVTAAALWREYFALNRYNFDPSLVNNVLQNLASALGHSRVTTTVKYYVNAPLFKHLSKVGTPEADLFRKLYDMLVMGKNSLSKLRQNLLMTVTELLLENQDDSSAVQALLLLTQHPDVARKQKSLKKPALVFDAAY